MKKHIIIYLLALWAGILHAQTTTNYLKGKITGQKFRAGSKVELLLFNPNHINISLVPDTVLTAIIDSTGTFSLKYIPPHPLFYMGMDFYKGTDSLLSDLRNDFLTDPFICQAGDSISLSLKLLLNNEKFSLKNKAWFIGKGADKYNAQYLINHYEEAKEAKGPYYNSGPFSTNEPIASKERYYLLQQQNRLNIADAFKDHIADTILIRIKQDIRAKSKYRFVSTFLLGEYVNGSNKSQQAVAEFINFPQQQGGIFSREDELIEAKGYADFILIADELRYRIKHKIHVNSEVKTLPPEEYTTWMYNNLKNNYNEILRESLLTNWLIDNAVSERYSYYLEPLVREAQNLVKLTTNKQLLDKVAKQGKGSKAYPFKFIDEKGKIHTLANYKDKILVLDFWYTGCLGCTSIPPVMKIIIDQFKNDKDVVFLSISIDRSMKAWKYGLKTELYALPSQVHLKTLEEGRYDPFILNYKINAYPKIMIIGKNGHLLAANPLDPRLDNGKDIVDLINKEIRK